MRDAARKLADRLHLRCLRHLALQFRLFAIVADREQHRRFAQSANPGDAKRDGFLPAIAQPHRQVSRKRRTAGIATNGIRHRRFIIANHQVAGIERLLLLADTGGFCERIVEKQKPSVTVGKRQPQWQQR